MVLALALAQKRHSETKGDAMTGLITTKHLISQAHVIIYNFGISVYLKCITKTILSDKPVTFLDCIQ